MNIKVKKLVKEAVLPKYAKDGDAAVDLTAISKSEVLDNEGGFGYIQYGTGLAFEIPKGFVGLIFPRSSISNTGLILSNSVGVIDSGYRGEVGARFKYIPKTKDYNIGDRIAQMIIMPIPDVQFEEVEELSDSERGEGGFGHTGK